MAICTALQGLLEGRLFNLVSHRATFTQWAEWLRTPLEHAVAEGNLNVVLRLLKAGAINRNASCRCWWWGGCDGSNTSMLGTAAESGDVELLLALLEAGAYVDLNAASGAARTTPLHRAISGGHASAARLLLISGANVSSVDSRGRTALHYAAQGGHAGLVGDLLIGGADPGAKDCTGATPFHLAARRGDDSSSSSSSSSSSCSSGTISTLLLRRTAVGDTTTKNRQQQQQQRRRRQQAAIIKVLNTRDDEGKSPLHIAVENGHLLATKSLLKAGADANLRCRGSSVYRSDDRGTTALHEAASGGTAAMIDTLVEGGANVAAQTKHKEEALHWAAAAGNCGAMNALLKHGANVDARDVRGHTPLRNVVTCTDIRAADAADILLRWGANERAVNADVIRCNLSHAGRMYRLLTQAPADRAWRRWGLVPLFRAFPDKVLLTMRCRSERRSVVIGSDGAATTSTTITVTTRGGNTKDDHEDVGVLARLAGLQSEAIFRTVVGFL